MEVKDRKLPPKSENPDLEPLHGKLGQDLDLEEDRLYEDQDLLVDDLDLEVEEDRGLGLERGQCLGANGPAVLQDHVIQD